MMKKRKPLDLFKPAETTGALVQAFRKNFEISQSDLAAACGLSQSNLSAIENDKREIGALVALKLSAIMGLSPEIILYPQGYAAEPAYQEALQRSQVILPKAKIRRAT